MSKTSVMVNLLQAFVAVVLGNIVYFILAPSLPSMARHRPLHLDLGMLLDFWFCLLAVRINPYATRWR